MSSTSRGKFESSELEGRDERSAIRRGQREILHLGVTVSISKRRSEELKTIVQNVSGNVQAGEILAIMGPSGSGKTTLLNVLAHRPLASRARVFAQILLNQQPATKSRFRSLSRFVESEEVLIGALTVRETLYFAARLGLGVKVSRAERDDLIEEMLNMFGLVEQADTIVGTLVRRGISTGQRRRLSVAAQLISAPRILFLDEPTSGLDSAASYKVMNYLKTVTRMHNLLVICSIHQPSSTTFELFDKALVMSGGRSCYFGKVSGLRAYLSSIGHPMPVNINPAEFVLDLINIDFEMDVDSAHAAVDKIQKSWEAIELEVTVVTRRSGTGFSLSSDSTGPPDHIRGTTRKSIMTVLHRNWIKSKRDVMVYAARLGMYLGLALLMGTVWLRLPASQDNIESIAHCILFGSAFMSFMAVVYVPAFIEDYQVFVKDRNNGLYGSTAFMISNFAIGVPYLFILAFVPSIFIYWMVNFRPDGTAFMIWVLWTYLNLMAAESLVVLVSAILPNFIGALAVFAMLNAVLMACNGFMVPRGQLNVFYRYVFYYINYQGYVYRGLAINKYAARSYSCGDLCQCRISSPLAGECEVAGAAVLQGFDFGGDNQSMLLGIMILPSSIPIQSRRRLLERHSNAFRPLSRIVVAFEEWPDGEPNDDSDRRDTEHQKDGRARTLSSGSESVNDVRPCNLECVRRSGRTISFVAEFGKSELCDVCKDQIRTVFIPQDEHV
nr:abc transporter g family member 11 [Quercus suber]